MIHGFLKKGTKFTTIDHPGSVDTEGEGINTCKQMVGVYADGGGKRHGAHGFLLSGTTFTPIDVPDATETDAIHLNNKGKIAGWYTDGSGNTHGFVAEP